MSAGRRAYGTGTPELRLIAGGQLDRERRAVQRRQRWLSRWQKIRWTFFLITFASVFLTVMSVYAWLVLRYK